MFHSMEIVQSYSTDYRRCDNPPKSGYNHTRKCIDGTVTSSNRCVGYCKYYGHTGYLTSKLRKKHDCIGKACRYYISKSNTLQRACTFD